MPRKLHNAKELEISLRLPLKTFEAMDNASESGNFKLLLFPHA
jgi:hypothetical protein